MHSISQGVKAYRRPSFVHWSLYHLVVGSEPFLCSFVHCSGCSLSCCRWYHPFQILWRTARARLPSMEDHLGIPLRNWLCLPLGPRSVPLTISIFRLVLLVLVVPWALKLIWWGSMFLQFLPLLLMLLFAEHAHRSCLPSSFGATVFYQMARLTGSHLSLWLLFQRQLESVWRPQEERRSLDTFYSSYHTGCLWSCPSLSEDFQPSLSLARLRL